jgi:YVTN family beta-propeller protein
VVAQIPVGVGPDAIAAGENAVWVANAGERTVTEIDLRTRTRGKSVSLDGTPTGLAVGLGRVWVAHGLLGAVTYFDPAFADPKTIPRVAGVTTGESRDARIAVGGGSVWAAFGDSEVVRIAPLQKPHVEARDVAGDRPSAVVFDAGKLWVANEGDNTVARFSPATFGDGALGTIHVGRAPGALTAGAGSLWIADSVDDRVTEVDESSLATNTIEVGRDPEGIAYGGGSVWVANAKEGTVSRIDAASGRVLKTIHVGNSPVSVAAGAGFVWVGVQAP